MQSAFLVDEVKSGVAVKKIAYYPHPLTRLEVYFIVNVTLLLSGRGDPSHRLIIIVRAVVQSPKKIVPHASIPGAVPW